jgi:hypothetical protein
MSATKFWVGTNATVVRPIGIIAASGSPDSDVAGLTLFCAPADAAGELTRVVQGSCRSTQRNVGPLFCLSEMRTQICAHLYGRLLEEPTLLVTGEEIRVCQYAS